MKIYRYGPLFALALLPLPALGQVYTYTAPNGVVTFSDRPPARPTSSGPAGCSGPRSARP